MRFLLAAVAVLAALAAPASATYGGRAATSAEASFTAYFTVLEGPNIAECSGVLVNRRYVLTAAHCVRPERPGGRVITVGRAVRVGNPGRRARFARVLRVSVHPRYRLTDTRAGYDLAILTLAKPLGTGVPVATPQEERDFAGQGAPATAIGFGINRVGQPVSQRRARTAGLEMLSPYNCVTPGLVDAFQKSQVCAAATSQGICAGDSGGPLVVRVADGTRRLVGITSLAIEDVPCHNVTGVFTRVAALRQWIMSRMGRTATSQPPPPPPGE